MEGKCASCDLTLSAEFLKIRERAGGKEEMALLTPDAFEDADEMQRQLGHANEEVRRSLNLPKKQCTPSTLAHADDVVAQS